MRLGLGVAIVGVLLAEIKFARAGLGHLAIQHYNFLRVSDMYAVLAITFALALAANTLMAAVGRRLVRRRN
jgi:ABC-type nitrate/sulfonate/bicarbonate transport system permease component